ncbi:hypothetical protein AK830_g1182 [Neonectria ditissima]|uniref:Uncharacterized protein n=1 Tax=Neonectria ditissima TaxID=78410 RepID=A0A0P7BV66_9HYPO|nr:hypothetical protein AK830_g1182 [Neonectria ditissima]
MEMRADPANRKMLARANLEEVHRQQTFDRRLKRLKKTDSYKTWPVELGVSSRTILIVWGFLVMVGFAVVFLALVDQTPEAHYGHFQHWTDTYATEIACRPENGTFDFSAGQDPTWPRVLFSSEFLDANGCQDPCPISPAFQGAAMFREPQELAASNKGAWSIIFWSHGESMSKTKWAFINAWVVNVLWVIVYVLLQGIWAAFLGRSQPGEARLRVYGYLLNLRLCGCRQGQSPGRVRRWLAQLTAFIMYLWSIFATILAVPFLVVNVVLVEIFLHELPQSESPIHVGAWSPYTSTALALIAVFIGTPAVKSRASEMLRVMKTGLCYVGRFIVTRGRSSRTTPNLHLHVYALQIVRHIFCINLADIIFESKNIVLDALHKEWEDTIAYVWDPDEELTKFLEHKNGDNDAENEVEEEQLQNLLEPTPPEFITHHAVTM